MANVVEIQWVGFRKDGDRGSVFGWFVETGHPSVPAYDYGYMGRPEPLDRLAYTMRGRIGKQLHIEEHLLTNEFISEMRAKQKNFRADTPARIMAKWGKTFDEEFSMFQMMMKLKA